MQSPATQRNAKKRETLQSLRGSGAPGNPDLLYSSITAVAPDKETIVGLQHKFLYMLSLLKNAETRPTQQALAGVKMLEETAAAVVKRWEVLK